MQRRSFMAAMLAACATPAIVRAESLMQLAAPSRYVLSGGILVPAIYQGMSVQLRGHDWWTDKVPLKPEMVFQPFSNQDVRITSFVIFDKQGHFVAKGGLNYEVARGQPALLNIDPSDWIAADL